MKTKEEVEKRYQELWEKFRKQGYLDDYDMGWKDALAWVLKDEQR